MANPQLVLMVKFKSGLPPDDMQTIMKQRADDFRALAGLQQKYYLQDKATGEVLGLYLWDSAEAFDEYRQSELRASIAAAYQAETEPRIEVYDVLMVLRDELP